MLWILQHFNRQQLVNFTATIAGSRGASTFCCKMKKFFFTVNECRHSEIIWIHTTLKVLEYCTIINNDPVQKFKQNLFSGSRSKIVRFDPDEQTTYRIWKLKNFFMQSNILGENSTCTFDYSRNFKTFSLSTFKIIKAGIIRISSTSVTHSL